MEKARFRASRRPAEGEGEGEGEGGERWSCLPYCKAADAILFHKRVHRGTCHVGTAERRRCSCYCSSLLPRMGSAPARLWSLRMCTCGTSGLRPQTILHGLPSPKPSCKSKQSCPLPASYLLESHFALPFALCLAGRHSQRLTDICCSSLQFVNKPPEPPPPPQTPPSPHSGRSRAG